MNSLPSRLRWPTLGLLACAVVAVPTARGQDAKKTPGDDKQQQIQAIEKQLAELQKKLATLKNPDVVPASVVSAAAVEGTIPDSVLKQFNWRCIGPANMGGRVTAIDVVESDPTTYYIATASGGLLKTTNNGTTFQFLFDKEATVSIGDVAVSQSKPEIVWVGTGENNPRNSVTYGDGVYKSTDAGKTWKNMGLRKSFQVGKVIVHPKDPDVVYVGALGRLYGPNEERGVFKTTDGGKTWDKVLYVDDKTGCIDLRMDPQDPETLVAAMWERKRDEYDGFFSGDKDAPPDMYGPVVTHGAGGGLFKTSDGGKEWKKLTDEKLKNGLPTVRTGRIGLDYSRKTKGLLFAIIDTEKVGTGRVSQVYLGVTGEAAEGGGAKIVSVTEGGPAAKGGLKDGDIVTAADGTKVASYDTLVDYFQGKNPGDKIKLTVKRGGKEETVEVTLGKRPEGQAQEGGGRGGRGTGGQVLLPVTGVRFAAGGEKLVVEAVTEDGPAAQAGVKEGDVVTAIDGKKVSDAKGYAAELTGKAAGDKIMLTITRDGKEQTVELTLASNPRAGAGGGGGGAAGGSGPSILMPGFVPEITDDGIKVQSLPAGGAAAKAGLKTGDLVVEVDGQEVNSFRDLMQALRVGQRVEDPRKAGDKVKIKVKQGEKTIEAELALVETQVPGMFGGGGRGATPGRPYGMGLGGQQANRQNSQGKDGFQTGGVYMSKDNGDTWTRVNSLNPRPMYFSQIRVDPSDDNTVYVLCDTPTPMYRSTDGGKTFTSLATARGVHADSHALWINPKNSRHLIIGCDGGFYVSYDKGAAWDHLNTLALGQFYHVAVDNKRPYRVYGGLQDNGSWGGPSHTLRRYGPVNEDWVFVSGGDGFVCRVDPTDPDLVYSESQGGAMSRQNFRTGERAGIRPASRAAASGEPRGTGEQRSASQATAPRPRFNWNTPFILSHHNPSIFYCGGQFVYRSVKKGDDLKPISPDMTRSPKGSMTALGESPRTPDVLWAGTDDGQLWTTKDAGANWTNVTDNLLKAGLPSYRWVATVEPSRTRDGRCYVVLDGHRSNDDKPYVFATDDFGATFKPVTANLPAFGSTRCLREDIVNPDVLYVGTEFGAWVSANRGASWSKLGGNLPTVAVHEFAQPTVANELVAATHGRSVWVLDVNAIRQMKPAALKEKVTFFAPAPAVRWKIGVGGESPYSVTDRKFVGQNPTRGATIEYLLTEKADKVAVKVVDVTGRTVRTFPNPPAAAGLHRLEWNLSGPSPRGQGAGGGGGGRGLVGTQVQPGMYRVVMTVGDKEYTHPLTVELDPNAPRDLIATENDEQETEEQEAEETKTVRKDD